MKHDDFIDLRLRDYAVERYNRHRSMSLRELRDSEDFHRVYGSNLDFLARNRSAVLDWLDARLDPADAGPRTETLGFFIDRMTESILRKNQFLTVGDVERESLTAVYTNLLAGVRDALVEADDIPGLAWGMERTLASHQRGLAGFSYRLAAAHARSAGDGGEALCSGYSPGLQIEILGIDPGLIAEPALDLGCGEYGALVRFLRSRSVAAFGVDRLAAPGGFLARADWFDFPLGRSCWGTVISHMGFTNHFLHHHLRANGSPERYARRYMEILDSLKPGGSFVYTPGVPFMEAVLPRDRWTVRRRVLPRVSGGAEDAALTRLFGESVFYSCRVMRGF